MGRIFEVAYGKPLGIGEMPEDGYRTDEQRIAELLPDPSEDMRQLLEYGNVGRSLDLEVDDTQTLLNLSGGDKVATVITVTLFTEAKGVRFPGPPAVALLKWGVGGTQASAEVDFLHGVSLALPASFIRVDARREPLGAAPELARLGAFASYLPKTVNIIPQRTLTGGVLGSGDVETFNVPFYAGNVRIYRQEAAELEVEFLNANLIIEYTIEIARNENQLVAIPLANSIRIIRIRKLGQQPALTRSSLIFGLAL